MEVGDAGVISQLYTLERHSKISVQILWSKTRKGGSKYPILVIWYRNSAVYDLLT